VRDPRAVPAPDLVTRAVPGLRAGPAVGGGREADCHGGGVAVSGVVLDVWSRAVVGWSMRPDARAELVVDALA
jgi:transposase InsO family protein